MKKKSYKCPVSHFEITEFPEFTDVKISEAYYVTLKKMGDSIVSAQNRGDISTFDVSAYYEIFEKFLEKTGIKEPFIEMRDYQHLNGRVTPEIYRRQTQKFLELGGRQLAFVVYNTPFYHRTLVKIGYKFFKGDTQLFACKDYRQAVKKVSGLLRISRSGDQSAFSPHFDLASLTYPPEYSYQSKTTNGFFRAAVVPGKIFLSETGGNISEKDLTNISLIYDKIFEEGSFRDTEYIRIADFSKLEKVPFDLKKKYAIKIRDINRKYHSRVKKTYLCGISPLARASFLLYGKFINQNFVFISTVQEAFEHLNGQKKTKPQKPYKVHKRDVDALIDSCGRFVWYDDLSQDHFTNPLPSQSPLFELGEALSVIHDDLKQLRVTQIRQIKRIKDQAEALRAKAETDPLTGVFNRNAFEDHLDPRLRAASRLKIHSALLAIDIKDFKDINNRYGHHIGDQVLKLFSGRLLSCVRKSDFIIRSGGDEFLVYLENITHEADAGSVALKIHETCIDPYFVSLDPDSQPEMSGQNDDVSSSDPLNEKHFARQVEIFLKPDIGIALYPRDGTNYKTLLKNADFALHVAKKQNADKYLFYDEKMNFEEKERYRVKKIIIESVAREYIVPFFQPIVDRNGNIVKAEVLARIDYPGEGIIPPAIFIHIAEETGLIEKIDNYILKKACFAAAEWKKNGHDVKVSVNITSRQLVESFPDVIRETLLSTGLPSEFLVLEVTEDVIMERTDSAVTVMEKIRGLGVSFSIDDFGTGHSSLARISHLPVNELKIDRVFVKDICEKDKGKINRSIIKAALEIAKSCDADTVIEGAESVEDCRELISLGCSKIQGFFFSRPVPEKEFIAMLGNPFKLL